MPRMPRMKERNWNWAVVDTVSTAERSRVMRLVKSRDTVPEMVVRKVLHAAGFRFRLHAKNLPGHPDIVLRRYKTVVLIHGCFWHWHGCRRSRMPSSNTAYWTKKIEGNVERDKRNTDALRLAGWDVEIMWECELKQASETLVQTLLTKRLPR